LRGDVVVTGPVGSEIFSRYMYAVVEADWIDELDYDAISTDRTSINWDDPNFEGFYSWGASSVKDWVKEYQKALKLSAKEEGGKLIDKVGIHLPIQAVERAEGDRPATR
ncbi:hypothetical protein AAIH37_35370, partial [Pseudomonas aeruginosa]|uniref:hypothetical protein n=1 Tax=Pseudomonas aeruginosa TaxID=287 RepID=UPI0031B77129